VHPGDYPGRTYPLNASISRRNSKTKSRDSSSSERSASPPPGWRHPSQSNSPHQARPWWADVPRTLEALARRRDPEPLVGERLRDARVSRAIERPSAKKLIFRLRHRWRSARPSRHDGGVADRGFDAYVAVESSGRQRPSAPTPRSGVLRMVPAGGVVSDLHDVYCRNPQGTNGARRQPRSMGLWTWIGRSSSAKSRPRTRRSERCCKREGEPPRGPGEKKPRIGRVSTR